MIEELKKNLEQERRIVAEMNFINMQLQSISPVEKGFYLSSLKSFEAQLKILNDAIPGLLGELSPIRTLDGKARIQKKPVEIIRVSYISPSTKEKRFITINKRDKEKFVKELSLSESGLKRLNKALGGTESVISKRPSEIARISNLVFGGFSEKIAPGFSSVKQDLKLANIRFSIAVYLSIALFVTFLVLFTGIVAFGVLLFIDFSFLVWIWVPFVFGIFCFMGFYFYPSLEKGSVEKKITNELPFATIYMAAIAGSNIEPTRIFKIIAISSEYPNISFEMKKIVNQVEVYGYDLVSVLKNFAKTTPNRKLSELFSGMATNIVSGGSLKSYLEKKSENLLVDYKLQRQRYSSVAETFMDIYISILITAPLVLMMLFIVMNLTNFGIGLTMPVIMALAIGGVVLVNIIFMVVLQLKQPVT